MLLLPAAIVVGLAANELIVGDEPCCAVAVCAGALPVRNSTTINRTVTFANNCISERNGRAEKEIPAGVGRAKPLRAMVMDLECINFPPKRSVCCGRTH